MGFVFKNTQLTLVLGFVFKNTQLTLVLGFVFKNTQLTLVLGFVFKNTQLTLVMGPLLHRLVDCGAVNAALGQPTKIIQKANVARQPIELILANTFS